MKEHDIPPSGVPNGRRIAGHAQDDHIIDTYKLRQKLADPARCPRCGAIYSAGRWHWMTQAPASAHEEICTACHRIADEFPAGIVTLKGAFIREHKTEMLNLARNLETAEKATHPLNRIMTIDEQDPDVLVITTTDIHLPRRIGEAVERAFHGELKVHYDENNYFVRVDWQRAR